MAVPPAVIAHGDMGQLRPFEVATRPLIIENPGRRAITIKGVHTCCGVSVPFEGSKIVPAHSAIALLAKVSPTDTALEKLIAFETDDPSQSIVECLITGEPDLSAPYAIQNVECGKITPGQVVHGLWTIFKGSGPDLTCNAVTTAPYIRVFVEEVDAQGNVKLACEVSEDTPRGEIDGFVFVTTGVPAKPFVSAHFHGEVVRGIRTYPEHAYFGPVTGGTPVTREVTLEILESGWDMIQVDSPELECLEAKIEKVDHREYKLTVLLDPTNMPQVLKSNVTIRDSSGDSFQVPVFAMREVPGPTSEASQ